MVGDIFLNMLNHGHMLLNRVCLLIFDECHKAVGSHPMRSIMKIFERYDKSEHPRVLGLSATLLNSNIKFNLLASTIHDLEVTLHSRITTVDSEAGIKSYGNVKESFIRYNPPRRYEIEDQLQIIFDHMLKILKSVNLKSNATPDESSKELTPKPKNKKLANVIEDAREHIETLGLYGGFKSVLLHIIRLETMKKTTDTVETMTILEFLVTQMTKLHKIIGERMSGYTDLEQIYKFSSDQVLKTLEILKQMNDSNKGEKKFCCIIFVKRRVTACVLYQILKTIGRLDKEYRFLRADYVIGFSCNPYSNPREQLCLAKWNREALRRFRSGQTNCIVATDVVDEGIDVPSCTLILRFDLPMDFRGYVQSKGRARHKDSNYVIMLSSADTNFLSKYATYKSIESRMKQILIGKTESREMIVEEEINEKLYKNTIDPYIVVNKEGVECAVTELSAISLINRYCTNLAKSKLAEVTPTWKLSKHSIRGTSQYRFKVDLTLPMLSPLRRTISGDIMDTQVLAKRSVALKTCIELHKIGELSDKMLPVQASEILANMEYLCPHWRNEPIDRESECLPGTVAKKRIHKIKHPPSLFSAFPLSEQTLYLHTIRAKPHYPKPYENRQSVFYELLNEEAGFAFLTTKRMPQIPDFPIFMNVGELSVRIEVNRSTPRLSDREIAKARCFHWTIFHKVLNLVKNFMIFDKENMSNSFLVVPTDRNGNVCWSTIEKYKWVEEASPSDSFNVRDYELALVKPNYRGSSSVYIVTQICDDIMAESAFPNGDFRSYVHYYKERHDLGIRNPKQPMLEVKAISTKINCTRPRGVKAGLSKRKSANMLEDFEEHFVGELCNRMIFPAVYWLKATYLPSVLHRARQLLVAESLRAKIAVEAGLGVANVPTGAAYWPTLKINFKDATDNDGHLDNSDVQLELLANDETPVEHSLLDAEIMGPEVDILESRYYPWKPEAEPTDLFRNIDEIQLIDIEYYNRFIMAGSEEYPATVRAAENQTSCIFRTRPSMKAPKLKLLEKEDSNGPSPGLIMQALTTKMSHDAFDLERLETLGDSFLKFAVSLFLHENFPEFNEGKLTMIKGKIIGNRNLFYCGESKEIPGRMTIDEFEPMSNFIAPAFTVSRPLQDLLVAAEISPNVLYELFIPENEQLTGVLSSVTLAKIEERVLSWNESNAHTGMEAFLDVQQIPDKCVSDCVEALIGVYLSVMNIPGAFELLKWFGILPRDLEVKEILFQEVATSPGTELRNYDHIMTNAGYIEQRIGYKFKNRAYLLQAFTHPSYSPNNITPCYERLEFLGDAILDLLITIYIYESCDNLSPGALTDLRSALVNNITFACLAVKYGYHTALLAYAPKLEELIERFVKFQSNRGHVINDELLWILLEEEDCKMAEFMDVPKVLGDVFESVIGAIYLDTEKNFDKVWEIVYGLMHNEILAFSKKVPKQPIRVIHETPGANPRFSKATIVPGTETVMTTLEVTVAGKIKAFHGFGSNKKQAKCAAAKHALKSIRQNI